MHSLHYEPLPPSLFGLSLAELESSLIDLFGEIAALKQTHGELREEIARLSVRPGTNRFFRIAWPLGVDRLGSPVTRWMAPIREVPNVDRREPSPTS